MIIKASRILLHLFRHSSLRHSSLSACSACPWEPVKEAKKGLEQKHKKSRPRGSSTTGAWNRRWLHSMQLSGAWQEASPSATAYLYIPNSSETYIRRGVWGLDVIEWCSELPAWLDEYLYALMHRIVSCIYSEFPVFIALDPCNQVIIYYWIDSWWKVAPPLVNWEKFLLVHIIQCISIL